MPQQLCIDILLGKNRIGSQEKYREKNNAAQEKAGELTGHDILRAVGIHAHEHERIRPEKSGV